MMKSDSGAIDPELLGGPFSGAVPRSEALEAEERRRIEGWLLAAVFSLGLWLLLAVVAFLVRAVLV